MDDRALTASPQLVEANRRLYELRAQVQAKRQAASLSAEQPCHAGNDPPWKSQRASLLDAAALIEKVETLPDHLGWGSEVLTAVLRRLQQGSKPDATQDDWPTVLASNATARPGPSANTRDQSSRCPRSESWIKLYPDIGLGCCGRRKRRLAASGCCCVIWTQRAGVRFA